MSAINGDKARFNRQRKKKIALRARHENLTSQPKAGARSNENQRKQHSRKQVSA